MKHILTGYRKIAVLIKLLFLDLLTVKSAQENDYIVNYSPNVWKGNVNIWLGLNYDSDGKLKGIDWIVPAE